MNTNNYVYLHDFKTFPDFKNPETSATTELIVEWLWRNQKKISATNINIYEGFPPFLTEFIVKKKYKNFHWGKF